MFSGVLFAAWASRPPPYLVVRERESERRLEALQSHEVALGEPQRRGLGQVRLGDAGDEVAVHALRDDLCVRSARARVRERRGAAERTRACEHVQARANG